MESTGRYLRRLYVAMPNTARLGVVSNKLLAILMFGTLR